MARKPAPTYAPLPDPVGDLVADGVLSVREAAAFLGHGRTWLMAQLASGAIPSFVMGGRRVVPRRALVRYLATQMRDARA